MHDSRIIAARRAETASSLQVVMRRSVPYTIALPILWRVAANGNFTSDRYWWSLSGAFHCRCLVCEKHHSIAGPSAMPIAIPTPKLFNAVPIPAPMTIPKAIMLALSRGLRFDLVSMFVTFILL